MAHLALCSAGVALVFYRVLAFSLLSAFVRVGTSLGMCYEDIFIGKSETLHLYEYIPRNPVQEKYPVFISYSDNINLNKIVPDAELSGKLKTLSV